MATGTYPVQLTATSGSSSVTSTASVGVGPIQAFQLQPLAQELVVRSGSSVSENVGTAVCCPPGPSTYNIDFTVGGLPTNVNGTFSPNPIVAGGSTKLAIAAASGTPWIQNVPINVAATAEAAVPAQRQASDFTVAPPPGNIPASRTEYLRTDETPQAMVYDAAHQLLFAAEPFLNRVVVVSTATRQILRAVPVLTPRGLALSLDGSEVLVGSDGQTITAISTTTLQIIQQWKLPRTTSPLVPTYGAYFIYPLSSGKVMLGLVELDVANLFMAMWDPVANTVALMTLPPSLPGNACLSAGSSNGTKVLVASCDSASVAVVYDVATNTFGTPLKFNGFIFGVAAAPDGSRFLIFDDTFGINLYNAQLQRMNAVPAAGIVTGFLFNADASRIYIVANAGVPVIFVDPGLGGQVLNTAPAMGTIPPGAELSPSPFVETPYGVDATGMIFGAADHGIAFDDSAYPVNYLLGVNVSPPFNKTVSPNTGPVGSATRVTFFFGSPFADVPDVWFGDARGQGASLDQAGVLSVTVPSSTQPGPVSAKVIEPDGTPIFDPLAFTYGPELMFVNGDTASPAGGATSHIVGLGLPTQAGQLQINVGGKPATVVSATRANFQSATFPFSYPYPATDAEIILPPGSGDADLEVTTPSGTATLSKAIHYATVVTDFSSADKFQSILLDRKRNQLYLAAGDHLDVFSLATNQFTGVISPPALNGQKSFHGMALTPDGSELLVSNFPDGSVALINPDAPASATAVQVIPPGTFTNPGPEKIAVTNTGKALIESKSLEVAGCGSTLYELTLATVNITTVTDVSDFCLQPQGFAMAAAANGSKVLLTDTDADQMAIYDSATNKFVANIAVPNAFGGNAAVSGDGTVFVTGSGITNAAADLRGFLSWQDVFETPVSFALPQEKIPDGGSLVFVPNRTFVDIFDVNHGARLRRVALSEHIAQVTDAMSIDANGQAIYLITDAGLTIVQLGAAPVAIGSISPSAGPSGATITIHGSGFSAATTMTMNGASVPATFVDANTLRAVVPGVAPGGVQIAVSDASGNTYTLDDAFTAQ